MALFSCRKELEAPVPDTDWPLFDSPGANPMPKQSREAMEGIYKVTDGASVFGEQVVLKWSYVAEGLDTTYYLSVFCSKDIAYFTVEGKVLGDSILLNGYWRKLTNTQTGIARFSIGANNGAKQLLSPLPEIGKDSIVISGMFGNGQDSPSNKLVLTYQRPVYKGTPLEILAHRSGGRTSDHMPYSENSIGMIKYASQLGATGIELDVRLTRDGVPILYHDNTLNLRLIQKNGLVGAIEDYSYAQLNSLVSLIDGEKIPTLRQALETVLNNTNLHFVWLDTKHDDSLTSMRNLQAEYLQKAKAMGRSLEIVIGLPGEDQLAKFKELPNYDSIPSACELSPEDVVDINAQVWAPRWTLGLQNDLVKQVQAEGRRAFVWTLDVPDYISQFINEGYFNGILSNYPSLVAYYYYVKE
ncbi:glycerophosphodiester phosphodiesterase [Flavihumibacter profundi]|uniref:glycerophosphodiester phosphodiesterase n=1 Tax=Flavihumibacter profundi TaxID=2716883 RepID=UPI001CC4C16B|nr:glycerophosphodiester phosphodiesterase [Flavihumibacter profundi]MBZ5856123.1 glycerophosphodiester phosphodiesterase [Flavihumibacter profundi]